MMKCAVNICPHHGAKQKNQLENSNKVICAADGHLFLAVNLRNQLKDRQDHNTQLSNVAINLASMGRATHFYFRSSSSHLFI